MADVLFDVDASQIIAKLHFAGLQKTRGGTAKGSFFVNTGIKDDDPNGTPEKLGKTRFDLTNKTATYQFGWITNVSLVGEKGETNATAADLSTKLSSLQKLRAELNDAADKTKLLDKEKDGDQKKKDEFKAQLSSLVAEINKDAEIAKANNIDSLDVENKFDEIFNSDDTLKNIEAAIKALQAKDSKSPDTVENKALSKAKDDAFKFIKDYMIVFAGADNVDVSEDKIGNMQVSSALKGPNDKGLVKLFEIQPITEQEKAKVAAANKANPKNASITLCFYVKYTLNIEK